VGQVRDRSTTLRAAAETLAEAGQPDQALIAIAGIDAKAARIDALRAVIAILTRVCDAERAAAAAEILRAEGDGKASAEHVSVALGGAARLLVRAGQAADADALVARLLVAAAPVGGVEAKINGWLRIGQVLWLRGRRDQAIEATYAASLCIPALDTISAQAVALSDVAVRLADYQESDSVTRIVDRTLPSIERIPGTDAKLTTLANLGRAMTRLGRSAAALEILRRAAGLAQIVPPGRDDALALGAVSEALAAAGDAPAAAELMKQALACAAGIVTRVDRASTLAWLVWPLVRMRAAETAAHVAARALAEAQAVAGERNRALALSAVAPALAEAGRVEQAIQVASSIEREAERAQALQFIISVVERARAAASLQQLLAGTLAGNVADRSVQPPADRDPASAIAANPLISNAAASAAAGAEEDPRAIEVDRVALTGPGPSGPRPSDAVTALRDALLAARHGSRERLFEMLGDTASALADLDGGQTLWHVFESVRAVEAWWDRPPVPKGA
jgi:tetratricopeptide (TPR) repeat protein